ncbi:unnamed protein product [Lathyrus sativus]|nr:unnamed protein product [Lathyrus sativus]
MCDHEQDPSEFDLEYQQIENSDSFDLQYLLLEHSDRFDLQLKHSDTVDLQPQQQQVQHQNLLDSPQQQQQQQQFLDLSTNNASSSSDQGINQNTNSRNKVVSYDGDQDLNQEQKNMRTNRHSHEQIREMEKVFKHCPHPDREERKKMSRVLGLEPIKIKFWFQNKRNQDKVMQKRHQNNLLRQENARLRTENEMRNEALKNTKCLHCGGPVSIGKMCFNQNQLRIENSILKAEIEMLSGALRNNRNIVESDSDITSSMIEELYYDGNDPFGSLSTLYFDKQKIIELAMVSMEELTRLTLAGAPLWISSNEYEIINEVEYIRVFPNVIGSKLAGFISESSRESMTVPMNHINLIETLMNVNQWSAMFSDIVSKAMTIEVLSLGVSGNYDGLVQVMSADFQVPSPLVRARENYFIRYCKKYQEGTWVVVDVSLDHLRPSSSTTPRSQRRPSGCLIQALPYGYSKVTWVEHVEVDYTTLLLNRFYDSLITSNLAFGAKRWVASLGRQCERLAYSMATNLPARDYYVLNSFQGRRILLNLAERMKLCFSSVVGSSIASCWNILTSDSDDVRVMSKTNTEPGSPLGVILNGATSLWLPVLPRKLFDFLGNQNSRNEWNILSIGSITKEMAQIRHGHDLGNCVSLFHANSQNSMQNNNMFILQDNSIDRACSHVIYAPIDIKSMEVVFNGGDPNIIALFPSGFVILPDGVQLNNERPLVNSIGCGGCLLTISFQILVGLNPELRLENGWVEAVVNLVKNTAERIKVAMT